MGARIDLDGQAAQKAQPTFAAIYRAQFGYVWASLRRLGVPEAQCDDAAQEVFVVVHRRLAEFDGRASVRTWLFEILRRVAAHQRRAAARRERRERAYGDLQVTAEPTSPLEQVAVREAGDRLESFLETLTDAKREVFVMTQLEGRRGPEVARELGVPLNTVYSRVRASQQAFARYCGELRRVEREAIAALQARSDSAPPSAQARVWGLLVPLLDLDAITESTAISAGVASPSTAVVAASHTASAASWLAGAKVFAASVAVSGAAVLGASGLVRAGMKTAPPATATNSPIEGDVAAPPASARARSTASPGTPAPTFAKAPATHPRPGNQALPRSDASEKASLPETGSSEPAAAAAGQLPPKPPGTPDSGLARESAILRSMKSARSRRDPAALLRHVEQHTREFPDGQLRLEREAYRAIALCQLDRRAEGRGTARRYLEEAAASPLGETVRRDCELRELDAAAD